jgi:hypothetical protein
VNLCRLCERDFSSVRAFDAHRFGTHMYTEAEGLGLDPPRLDGRRCLRDDELTVYGFAQEPGGRWFQVEHRERTRRDFVGRPYTRDGELPKIDVPRRRVVR